MPGSDQLSFLTAIPVFAELSAAQQSSVAQNAPVKTYPKGTVLFLQGDSADAFFVVRKGWVKLYRETMEGQEAIVGLHTVGDTFGEAVIFQQAIYPCSAETVEDSEILRIPGNVLAQLVAQDKSFAMRVMSSMSQRMNKLELKIEHMEMMNASQRVGCFLLGICRGIKENRAEIQLPVDKALVAASLGMKPETFSRALAPLKDIGVESKGPAVIVGDVKKLQEYTCNSCSRPIECDDD